MSESPEHDEDFVRLIKDLPFDDAPSRVHRETLHRDVMSRYDRVQAKTTDSHGEFQVPPKRMFLRASLRWAIIAVVCVLGIFVWLMIPGSQTPELAFRRLAIAVADARTAQFQIDLTQETRAEHIVRALFQAPGRFRQEKSQDTEFTITIVDEPAAKQITLFPTTRTAVVSVPDVSAERTVADDFFQLRDFLSRNFDLNSSSFRRVGTRQIDGRAAIGFVADTKFGECTLWGDARTGNPLRIELVQQTKRRRTTMRKFELNIVLEESLFELAPPEGYKVNVADDPEKAAP